MSVKHSIPLYFFFCLILGQPRVFAQEIAPPETLTFIPARPGNSPFPSRLPKGALVFETAFERNREKSDFVTNKTTYSPFHFRYGLMQNAEVNISFAYQSLNQSFASTDSTTRGLGATRIGAKFRIAEERGIFPLIEFHGILKLPYFGEESFAPDDVEPSFNITFLHNHTESLQISYGFGMFWRGPDENGFYGIKATKFFNRQNAFFGEHYSYLRGNERNEAHLAVGYLFLKNNKFQFDISADVGKIKGSTIVGLNLGVSVLLRKED